MPKFISNHANFDSNDYSYLASKGWTNKEISQRWTEEAKSGNGACKWEGFSVFKLNSVTK